MYNCVVAHESSTEPDRVRARRMIQAWVSLPWAGPGAYYGVEAAATAQRLESLGVSGVVQGDHLFLPGPSADDPTARMAADCLTVLTTIAAHSSRLGVASLVANIGLQHPLPLLRRFASLALIHGGDRVYAGLGAGWSKREFEALGLTMPPHRERLARLAETAELARTLFERGWVQGRRRARSSRRPPARARTPHPSAPPARGWLALAPRACRTPCRPRRPRTALPPQGGERVPTAAPDDDRRPGRVGALGTRSGPGFDGLPVAHRRRGLQRERQA